MKFLLAEHFIRNTSAFTAISSADHVAAVQCIKSCRYGPPASGIVHTNHENEEEKCGLSDFDHGMIISATLVTADLRFS